VTAPDATGAEDLFETRGAGPEMPPPDNPAEQRLPEPVAFTVVTFNVGTTTNMVHDRDEEEGEGDGYTGIHAQEVAANYGNNLSWIPAEEALAEYLAQLRPEIIGFQEMFYDPWCEDIEPLDELDLVCEDYSPERPLQVERLLGDEYQVACAFKKPDNCLGVRRDFGRLVGCPEHEVCLEGLEGLGAGQGCSDSARVGTAPVELVDGRILTVVVAHANAGMTLKDQDCRILQFKQIFEDRGDGIPAACGEANLVMGDMNTDPFLLAEGDPSAAYWNTRVGEGRQFAYVSAAGPEGPATHVTTMHLDHIISDAVDSDECYVPGVSEGVPPVMETTVFDHRPVVCSVSF